MPVLLLLLLGMALTIGMTFITLLIRRSQRLGNFEVSPGETNPPCPLARVCAFQRPSCWLAIRSRSLQAVQCALNLHNPKPCSWIRGLTGEEKLFIAPPVGGWILVMGSGLPDPNEDVDSCFRFVLDLSRKLGQVQFFSISRPLRHHAWVRADKGKVVRAYAWAGRTLWEQGSVTLAEQDLDLKCFGYAEPVERTSFDQPDPASLNVDKVPLLAARWSLDPGGIDERLLETAPGIAGEPSHRY
jgi:hypothetical protein